MSTTDPNAVVAADLALPARAEACAACGAPVEAWDRFCPSCGTERPGVPTPGAAAAAQRFLRCQNCGAEVGIDPGQRSYRCAFCDSTYVVEFTPEQTGRQEPEFVIGFAIAPEQALERFRQWLRAGSWFRPGDLHRAAIEERLKGVYLPFWSFSMLAESDWSARIGEYWYRTETYTVREGGKTVTKTRRVRETEWWPLSGRHHRFYSGYLVSASRGLPQRDADRIQPFHLAALARYQPYFLAGWLSEEYSVDRDEALQRCREEFHRREWQNVVAHLPGDTHDGLQVVTRISRISSDLILLPVYLLSYRYQNRVYRFLLNGQTGKAAGDKPVSLARVAIAVVIGAAALLLVLLMLLFAMGRG